MSTLHPSCIYILRGSLNRSVKRTWTSSAFPTNGHMLLVLYVKWPLDPLYGARFTYKSTITPLKNIIGVRFRHNITWCSTLVLQVF